MVPLKARIALGAVALAGAFAAGWAANGWRLGLVLAEWERDLARSEADASEAARDTERAYVMVANEIAARYEAEKAADEAEARAINKEVVEYEKAPYAGRCQLPNHWVRIDTASALGLPKDSATASGPDDAPSGFTDADALEVVTERNRICRAEIKRLEALQEYVRGLSGVAGPG